MKITRKDKSLMSYILLQDGSLDMDLFIDRLKDWNVFVPSEAISHDRDGLLYETNGIKYLVVLSKEPMPTDLAAIGASRNFRWDGAEAVAKNHKACLLVSVFASKEDRLKAAKLLVQICAAALKLPNAMAVSICLSGLLEPAFYLDGLDECFKEGKTPVLNLVNIGVYSNDGGKTYSGYTDGLKSFDKLECEIINSSSTAEEVYDMLTNVAFYCIENDVTLKKGETIGLSQEQRIPITLSKGVATGKKSFKLGL